MSSDAPPKLTELPQHSAFQVPTLSSTEPAVTETEPVTAAPEEAAPVEAVEEPVTTTASEPEAPSTLAAAKESVFNNAQAAYGAVANHPTTQAVKDTVANGPIAEGVKNQTAKTNTDIQGLANARTVPETSTSNGQPLTHYHSFFYSLLSWEHPRATAISFASTIALIFAARYLPLLRWFFKVAYVVLGVTAAAEIAGRLTINQGLASSFRPRRYYTIPRESLEAVLEDVEQLINFFVIEFQRVIFAENVAATVATFAAAFLSYWLIKWLPLWGLSLIAATTVYLAPFIYINNREMIDGHLNHAHGVISAQASQVRDLAGQHTGRATDSLKQYAGDYSAKAQSLLNNRGGMSPTVKSEEFPTAPKHEPIKTENGAEPVPAY